MRFLPGLKDVLPLLIAVAVLTTGRSMLDDSDTGWHVRVGERILEAGEIPRADPFSFSAEGKRWFAWEWLSDVAMAEIHRVSGLRGLVAVSAVILALSFSIAQRLGLSLGGRALPTFGLTALAATASTIHWLARPHIVTCLLAVVFLAVLETGRPGRSRAALWSLVPLSVLWCNLHGAFVLGLVLIGTYLTAGLLPGAPRRWPARDLALVLAGSAVATVLNPYGLDLHRHVLAYLREPAIALHIEEFQSPDFHSIAGRLLELWLLAVALAIGVSGARRDWPRAVLLVALVHLSLTAHRHVDVLAVCSAPLVAAALAGGSGARGTGRRDVEDSVQPTREAQPSWSRLRHFEEIESRQSGVWGLPASVALAAVAALAPGAWTFGEPFEFPASKLPVQAAERLRDLGVDRALCSDSYGGYLIYRWDGEVKVFIDGRSDFYATNGVLEDYIGMMRLHPGWEERIARYAPDAVVLPSWHPVPRWMVLQGDWRPAYEDSTAVILLRSDVNRREP